MSDYYYYFSEEIVRLTPAECEWVETYLTRKDLEGVTDEEGEVTEEGKIWLDTHRLTADELDDNHWPSFAWKIEGRGTGDDVKHSLWMYSEGMFHVEHVTNFLLSFLSVFRPDEVICGSWACTCSRPILGQFGGGWWAVSRNEIQYGNTWDEAAHAAKALKTCEAADGLLEWLEKATSEGLESEDLDNLVHDTASQEGSGANNVGLQGQLRYLLEQGSSEDEILTWLSDTWPELVVTCKLCKKKVSTRLAHRHDGEWVGHDCCWDPRLKVTE